MWKAIAPPMENPPEKKSGGHLQYVITINKN